MAQKLKILYVSAEVAPLAKTGGLGDVAGALPRTLQTLGHDVRVAMPCYRQVPESARGEAVCDVTADLTLPKAQGTLRRTSMPNTEGNVPLYLVQNADYFDREYLYGLPGGEYDDNLERFAFFCNAVLDGMRKLDWQPDVINCNDWHTCLIPAYLRVCYPTDSFWSGVPTILSIHNLIYQGIYPAWRLPVTGLPPELYHPDCLEFYGDINIMKAGIAFANKINAVSQRYAKEIQSGEQGAGLEGFLRMRSPDISGILNGADYKEWNPAMDRHIAAKYSPEDMSGKLTCKRDLQKWAGLPESDVPLFGVVSRLVWQKGVDIMVDALDDLMEEDLQLVILGTGDPVFEDALMNRAEQYPEKFRLELRYDDMLAHRIEAGSDFFLMPSHFEPSGLSQLYSLAYGSVPLVRKTGGLADTVTDSTKTNIAKGTATGVVFEAPTAAAFMDAIKRALALYKDKNSFRQVQATGMKQDFSWERAAKSYLQLYRAALNGRA